MLFCKIRPQRAFSHSISGLPGPHARHQPIGLPASKALPMGFRALKKATELPQNEAKPHSVVSLSPQNIYA